jgi:hypothetical protein
MVFESLEGDGFTSLYRRRHKGKFKKDEGGNDKGESVA